MAQITQLSDLYVLMMQELPDCPTYLILQHLQQALREFCQRTEAWREELAPINLVDGTVDYTLVPSFDCEIKRVNEVWIRSADEVTADDDGTLQDPSLYEFTQPQSLKLDDSLEPDADVADGMVVKVTLIPFLTQTGTNVISKEFLNEWAEAIMFGAMASLMGMERQRWSSPGKAAEKRAKFMTKITDAMFEANMEYRTEAQEFGA